MYDDFDDFELSALRKYSHLPQPRKSPTLGAWSEPEDIDSELCERKTSSDPSSQKSNSSRINATASIWQQLSIPEAACPSPNGSSLASASSSSSCVAIEDVNEANAPKNTVAHSTETQEALEHRFRAIRKQLKRCSHRHQGICQARLQLSRSDMDIYLIDVRRMCLVKRKTFDTGYLTLSYVWGSIPQYTLTKDRVAALSVEGAIEDVLNQLPRVIRDSIAVTRLLRATFLWVDSLCIVQDESQSKHDQIKAEDSSSRLPCLGKFQTVNHYKTMLKKRPPSSYRGLAAHLNRSKYGSRAWTFQERLLSWRCLYCFTDQVVLRCSQSIWYHGVFNGEELLDPSARLLNLPYDIDLIDKASIEFRYATVVQQYSVKELRYLSDTPAAFAGIANVLESWHGCDLRFGIPQASEYLYIALMWFPDVSSPHYAGTRRRLADDIPSWSWMGWTGPTWYPILRQSHPVFEGQAIVDEAPFEQIEKLTWQEMSRSFFRENHGMHHSVAGKIIHLEAASYFHLGNIQSKSLPGSANSRGIHFWEFSPAYNDFAPLQLYACKEYSECWTMRQDKGDVWEPWSDSRLEQENYFRDGPRELLDGELDSARKKQKPKRVGIIFGLSRCDMATMAESKDEFFMFIMSASTTTQDFSKWRVFDIDMKSKVELLNFILVRLTVGPMFERVAAGRILSSALKDYLARMPVKLV